MLFMKNCPICTEGLVGFLLCPDNETLVLACDECDTVWLDPQEVNASQALYPSPPDFRVPNLDCSLRQSRWATREEVTRRGWDVYIAGEGPALNEA